MKTNLISIIEHTPTFKGMKALKEKRVLTFDIESLIINGSHIPHIITIHTGQDPTFIFKINKELIHKIIFLNYILWLPKNAAGKNDKRMIHQLP